MSIYLGLRDSSTRAVTVTVDGLELPLRLDLANHSPCGFEWGYSGSGPAQLALAILADHFKRYPADVKAIGHRLASRESVTVPIDAIPSDVVAVSAHQRFKAAVIAKIDGQASRFTMTSLEVTRALEKLVRSR